MYALQAYFLQHNYVCITDTFQNTCMHCRPIFYNSFTHCGLISVDMYCMHCKLIYFATCTHCRLISEDVNVCISNLLLQLMYTLWTYCRRHVCIGDLFCNSCTHCRPIFANWCMHFDRPIAIYMYALHTYFCGIWVHFLTQNL